MDLLSSLKIAGVVKEISIDIAKIKTKDNPDFYNSNKSENSKPTIETLGSFETVILQLPEGIGYSNTIKLIGKSVNLLLPNSKTRYCSYSPSNSEFGDGNAYIILQELRHGLWVSTRILCIKKNTELDNYMKSL